MRWHGIAPNSGVPRLDELDYGSPLLLAMVLSPDTKG
jgi:hypothetical protein